MEEFNTGIYVHFQASITPRKHAFDKEIVLDFMKEMKEGV